MKLIENYFKQERNKQQQIIDELKPRLYSEDKTFK